jgi:hypothetical protein
MKVSVLGRLAVLWLLRRSRALRSSRIQPLPSSTPPSTTVLPALMLDCLCVQPSLSMSGPTLLVSSGLRSDLELAVSLFSSCRAPVVAAFVHARRRVEVTMLATGADGTEEGTSKDDIRGRLTCDTMLVTTSSITN